MIKIRRKNSEDSFLFIVEQKVRKRKKRNYEKEGDWCFGGKLNIKGYFCQKCVTYQDLKRWRSFLQIRVLFEPFYPNNKITD